MNSTGGIQEKIRNQIAFGEKLTIKKLEKCSIEGGKKNDKHF